MEENFCLNKHFLSIVFLKIFKPFIFWWKGLSIIVTENVAIQDAMLYSHYVSNLNGRGGYVAASNSCILENSSWHTSFRVMLAPSSHCPKKFLVMQSVYSLLAFFKSNLSWVLRFLPGSNTFITNIINCLYLFINY